MSKTHTIRKMTTSLDITKGGETWIFNKTVDFFQADGSAVKVSGTGTTTLTSWR